MLKVAVLPFNAGEGVKPQLGRQIPAFVADQLRSNTEADIQTVSFLTQVEQQGVARTAFVNVSDGLLELDQLSDLFEQSGVDLALDGMIQTSEKGYQITARFTHKGQLETAATTVIDFSPEESFTMVNSLVKSLAEKAQIPLPEALAGDQVEYGTQSGENFLNFLIGYDALNYIQQADGLVALEFNPEEGMNTLIGVVEADPEFQGAYQVAVSLARACTAYQIGNFELVDQSLVKLSQLVPNDFAAFFALGELHQAGQNLPKAVDYFEKASQLSPDDPAVLNRLGNAQAAMNMFVNAERNFRRAVELEGDEKPSLDFLVGVLSATGRDHEIPGIWKEQVEQNPANAQAHAKYAVALIQNSKEKEGVEAFENAIATLEDNVLIKRYYAPYLAQHDDLDRAMDFYEDCLDVAPNDIPLLLEYAQTLQAAERDFEIAEVLRTVLKSNPDPNTAAQTNAWLIELEQPKRIESVQLAEQKLAEGDVEGAIRDLKPLRNWLADYWKLWAMLSSAYNRIGDHAEAEVAAQRLLSMYPGCEPAYGELREALNGQGKHDEAWNFMQYAFSNNSQSFGIFINLGLAAAKAGHREEANQIAGQIREVMQGNPEMEAQLKDILAQIEA